MKKSALFLGFFLLFAPSLTQAASPSCSANGYTVVFVNGVFDTLQEANSNANALQDKLGLSYNSQRLVVQTGYNPTHLAGAADLAQTASQLFGGSISRFDLDTILMQVYPEVTTRKLLLVGHSQGAFYTNSMYDYLLTHGEPDSSVAVYNVASPAAYTAGHGKYINSSGDTALTFLRDLHFDVLPNNTFLLPVSQDGGYSGHSFVADYLEPASVQMLGDMDSEMSNLQPTNATSTGDCFTPPVAGLGYKSTAVAFAVADPTATVLKVGTVTVVHAGEVALNAVAKVAVGALQMFADTITVTTQPPTDAQKTADTEKIIDKLYGSSVDNLSPQDKKDLLGSSQGAGLIFAVPPTKPAAPKGVVLGTSTVVVNDSNSTQIVPKNIFPDTPNGPAWTSGGLSSNTVSDSSISAAVALVIDPVAESTPITIEDPSTSTPSDTTPITTDVVDLNNPEIVINEVQWAGDYFDPGREWIEIKNRTSQEIDLSKYVLYAKDGGSQYIQLSGTLPGSTYQSAFFVVERDSYAPFSGSGPSWQFNAFDQLSDSGEQLALARVSETGTTTIDMTPALTACSGWCAGSVDAQGVTISMERVSSEVAGTEPTNWASNDRYTVSGMPYPKGQPWLANGMPLYATPLAENSHHWPDVGFFCAPDVTSILAGQSYHPPGGQCTALGRDLNNISAAVFKGTVGSSTEVGVWHSFFHINSITSLNVDFSDAQAGDTYFVAVWSPFADASFGGTAACINPMDDIRVPAYLTTGHWLGRDGYCGDFTVDMTDKPDINYQLIPFTYQP